MAKSYTIGEFVLESKLGAGGMGVVFRARQVSLQRWVALKLLSRPASSGSKFVQRFYREARATAQLVHPNIIQTYTIGEHKGAPFFAMEYVEGCDLASMLKEKKPLSIDESLEVIRSVTKALNVAAEHSIVHRDIKPANIMISKSGLVKVMDFGLAKAAAVDDSLTQDGQILGTPSYMSPEQGQGKDVDTRSDIYSLGCVFYQCLTGQQPFQADNVPALIFKQLYEEPEPPSTSNSEVSEKIEAICAKMMAKDVAQRFQDPQALLEALSEIPSNASKAEMMLAKRAKGELANDRKKSATAGVEEFDYAKISDEGEASPPTILREIEGQMATEPIARKPKKVDPSLLEKVGTNQSAETFPVAGEKTRLEPLPPPIVHDRKNLAPSPPQQVTTGEKTLIEIPPSVVTKGEKTLIDLPDFEDVPETDSPAPLTIILPELPSGGFGNQKKKIEDETSLNVPPPPVGVSRRISTRSLSAATTRRKTAALPKMEKPRSAFSLARVSEVSPEFSKRESGHWSYDVSQGHCKHASGLAAEKLVGFDIFIGQWGDCLICSNWTKRSGCALAVCQELDSKNRTRGAKLVEDMALVWCSTGQFGEAIGLLEDFIQSSPDDPAAYIALARIFDRPDYSGKDRHRAIIMYDRFLALAGTHAGYSELEINRAKIKLASLRKMGGQVHKQSGFHSQQFLPDAHFVARCFCRHDRLTYFGLCAMSWSSLYLVHLGELNPDTDVWASDFGGGFFGGSKMFKRIKGDRARASAREAVTKELGKLGFVAVSELPEKASKCQALALDGIEEVKYKPFEPIESGEAVDPSRYPVVTIQHSKKTYEFIFDRDTEMDAEKLALLLKRFTAK